MKRRGEAIGLGLILLLAAAAFGVGINWGLPSRAADPFLFGGRRAWSGRQIEALAPLADEAGRAADVSQHPIAGRGPLVVNATDAQRARIVRRYRLMSYQPDEFTTFAALAHMHPRRGDFDPRMYKYGGLWVYPVGGLLKIASALHLVELRPDLTWYLDHPQAFGRFYVVARTYSAFWGLLGVLATYLLVRRITGQAGAAAVGAVCFALMPVVVNSAHEAKPHLAGAVLMLLAVLAAARFVEKGSGWIVAALLCGAAVGMVPSAAPVLLVIPLMFALRERHSPQPTPSAKNWITRSAAALAVSLGVFVASNPYVAINLVRNRAVLRSNVGNSAAFYSPALSGSGILNAMLLVGLGASFIVAAIGIIGAVALGVRAVRMRSEQSPEEARRRAAGLLLAAPAGVIAIVFVLLAGHQPADYARFALFFDVFLLVEAVVAIATFMPRGWRRCSSYALLIASTLYMGHIYVHHALRDCTGDATRLQAASRIQGLLDSGGSTLVTPLEPAPWSMPPVNLFRWTIVLDPPAHPGGLPANRPNATDVVVYPVEVAPGPVKNIFMSAPISWASKPFRIVPPRSHKESRAIDSPSR